MLLLLQFPFGQFCNDTLTGREPNSCLSIESNFVQISCSRIVLFDKWNDNNRSTVFLRHIYIQKQNNFNNFK